MTILNHELRQNRLPFLIWTGSIALLLAVCIALFPEIESQMEDVSSLFASMGSFTAAFGMDRLDLGAFSGFYAVECGNVLGLGGAFFAALTAASILSKEERDKTAEFLLTHPVSRSRAATEKLCAAAVQVTAMNLLIFAVSAGSAAVIGETLLRKEFLLLHLAYLLMQLEITGICFGLSAFLRRSSPGAGLGLAAALYVLNLTANIAESARFLRWPTPFAYCEGADITARGGLDVSLVLTGLLFGAAGITAAYVKYCRKDIAA